VKRDVAISGRRRPFQSTEENVKPEQFAEVLRKVPKAVAVVTVGRGGAENGLTVSWASPVSFDPPQFMFAVDQLHYSVDFLKSTRNFAVSFLREGQERISGHFARQSFTGEQKLEKIPTRESQTGAAILTDALAYFDCELVATHPAGDHLIVVGKVVDCGVLHDGNALMTHASLAYQKGGPRR
jgi:flavin reductase (DIM6/NTAB) family NADH-FMN oxidoreductase RutF